MGWFNKKPSLKEAVEGLGTVAKDLKMVFTDKVTPDVRMDYEIQLKKLDMEIGKIQTEVNQAEAKSGNLFIAGWRPMAGWICDFALLYNFILYPFLAWLCNIYQITPPPLSDNERLFTLLLALLGLGGYRTYEKFKDVHDKH